MAVPLVTENSLKLFIKITRRGQYIAVGREGPATANVHQPVKHNEINHCRMITTLTNVYV